MSADVLTTIHLVTAPDRDLTTGDRFNRILDLAAQPLSRPLTWLWNRGFRVLMVIDALVLFSTLVAVYLVRFGRDWPTYPLSHYWIGFSVATAIHLAVNYFSGLYEREPLLGSRPWLPRVAIAMGVSVAIDGLAALMLDRYLMPRLNLAFLAVAGTILLTLTRSLSRLLADRRRGPSRVVLIGSEVERDRVRSHLGGAGSRALIVGESDEITAVPGLVEELQPNDVLLLDLEAFTAGFPEPLSSLARRGIGVHQRVSAAETLLGLSAIREIGGVPFARLRLNPLAPHQLRLKRLFDVTLTLATAPIWLLVIGLLATYSRLVAGRGVFFRQERVGLFGEPFMILKFRTMVHDAERETGPVLAEDHDQRVVKSLQWLRSSRLDELPQLFNVIRGTMSLVGPRPERPEFVDQLRDEIDGYERRHQLPPGITGLAQTKGRYDTNPAHKLGYDLQYLVNWSIALDLQITAHSGLAMLLTPVKARWLKHS